MLYCEVTTFSLHVISSLPFLFFTFLFCYFYGSLSVFIKNTQVMSLSFNVCCRLNNSLPKVSTCESPEPKNMLPHMVKGTLQMWWWLRTLRCGDYFRLSGWARYNHKYPTQGGRVRYDCRKERQCSEEAEQSDAARSQGSKQPLEARRGQEQELPWKL